MHHHQSLKHNLHGTHYHLSRLKELKKLFFAHSIAGIAASFIGIFIPIYMLTIGYAVVELITLYFFIGLFKLILLPAVFYMISRVGGNIAMAVGLAGEIVAFLLLATLPQYSWPLAGVAFFKAIHGASYYAAFHANFSLSRSHEKTGRSVGKLYIITLALGIVTPAVSGYIASFYGINWLYGAAIALFVVSSILLLKGGKFEAPGFAIDKIPFRRPLRDYAANFAQNFSGLSDIFAWTLLVYFIIPSYVGVGFISSISVLSSFLITLYVGKKEDTSSEKPYISLGSLLATVASVIRAVVVTPLQVVGVNFLSGVSSTLLSNAFTSRYYRNSDNELRLEYMFGMEIANASAWIIFFGGLYLLSLVFSVHSILVMGVLAAIPATLAIRFMR